MDIQNNPAAPRSAPLQFDLTKLNREAIKARQPLTPQPEAPQAAENAKDPAAIERAREEHRENFRQRVSDQRSRWLENTADRRESLEKTRLERRQEQGLPIGKPAEAAAASLPAKQADRIEISTDDSRLVERIKLEARIQDPTRAQRVQELRNLYLEGKLTREDLAAFAAEKMLRGE